MAVALTIEMTFLGVTYSLAVRDHDAALVESLASIIVCPIDLVRKGGCLCSTANPHTHF